MTNDLISREALRNIMKCNLRSWGAQGVLVDEVMRTIDNAPTVDIKDQIAGAYNEGYMCGNKEAEKARPQGEWITDEKGYFYCGKCGKYPHDQYATTNFCPNCGADMRTKGGVE